MFCLSYEIFIFLGYMNDKGTFYHFADIMGTFVHFETSRITFKNVR